MKFDINVLLSELHRNNYQTMIEVMYSCGLRVSEVIEMKISNIFFDESLIKVMGKGKKERFVPLSGIAKKLLCNYIECERKESKFDKQSVDIVFLNNRGGKLSRIMVYNIINDAALAAEITGMESALLVSSGTMGNLVSNLVHCPRGTEVIMGNKSHTFIYESGGISTYGGIHSHQLKNNNDGTISPGDELHLFLVIYNEDGWGNANDISVNMNSISNNVSIINGISIPFSLTVCNT